MTNKLSKDIDALFVENGVDTSQEDVTLLDVDQIRPNPYQPRHIFNEAELKDLSASIKNAGVFQPIIVRRLADSSDQFELLTGERRLRASKLANKATIPAIIRPVNEEQMMEIAILENLQRQNLTTLEEAEAYETMMTKLDLTQAQVAKRLGKSRPYVANYLRILGLPPVVKQLLQDELLSMGQARTILGVNDKTALIKLANEAVRDSLTVRQLEKQVAVLNGKKTENTKKLPKKSPFVKASEDQLQEHFGTAVSITTAAKKKGQGKIEIEFTSNDDLSRILELLDVDLG